MKLSLSMGAAALTVLLSSGAALAQPQLESPRLGQSAQRTEFPLEGEESSFRFSFVDDATMVENAAALSLQFGRGASAFLSTLPNNGAAQFLTVLKPCGIVLPHLHPRGNELYSIISGTQSAGIAQENGALQDITFQVEAGETFIVPQGLLHFNHNQECVPNAFFQSFDSSDAGAINVIGALAALGGAGDDGAAAILASNAASVTASPQGAFALDQACLTRCGLPETGGDLSELPAAIGALFGLDTSAPPPSDDGDDDDDDDDDDAPPPSDDGDDDDDDDDDDDEDDEPEDDVDGPESDEFGVLCETDEDCEGVFDTDSNFSANSCRNLITTGLLAGRVRGSVVPGEVGRCGLVNIAPPGP